MLMCWSLCPESRKGECMSEDLTNISEEWTSQVSRGGLYFISNSFYDFLVSVETIVRKCYTASSLSGYHGQDIRKRATEDIFSNSRLLKQWNDISICLQTEKQKLDLLIIVVKLYLVIRGFAFAKFLVQQHEQATNAGSKGQKGLRNSLKKYSNTTDIVE